MRASNQTRERDVCVCVSAGCVLKQQREKGGAQKVVYVTDLELFFLDLTERHQPIESVAPVLFHTPTQPHTKHTSHV